MIQNNKGPFDSFGEQLRAVFDAAVGNLSGREPDPRLLQIRAAPATAGASEMVPSDGGFLVQPEFSRELLKRLYQTGELIRRCLKIPVLSSNATTFPQMNESSRATGSRMGGIQCFTENEGQALIDSKPDFQKATLTMKKITGLLYVTDELSMDSSALDAWALYAFSQELNFVLENLIVIGTGAGEPLGVLNAPALITIAKESGQASGTIVSANVIKMVSRLWAASRKNAVWLYNQDALTQLLALTTVVGSAGSQANLFNFAFTEDGYDRIAGIPAFPSEYCPVLGTPGDLILADFSRYVVAMRDPLKADVSIHVKFLTDESAFRFIMRVDGQPIDNTAVTPLNALVTSPPSAQTTSTFLAIAAR